MSRYRSDPIFRKNHNEAVKRYRQRKAKEKRLLERKEKAYKKYWLKLKINGEVHDCCRIGFVASVLGVETNTVRSWHNKGIIPETVKYKGVRYYTEKHFKLFLTAWEKYPHSKKLFFNYVRGHW